MSVFVMAVPRYQAAFYGFSDCKSFGGRVNGHHGRLETISQLQEILMDTGAA